MVSLWSLVAAAILSGIALPAVAQVKIGQLYTLGGPFAGVGTQARDGFALALKLLNGRLGDVAVRTFVEDDEQKPEVALAKIKTFHEIEKVDFVVGPLLPDLLAAAVKPVTDAGAILISPRAGPALLAGKQCNAGVFVLSHQSEQLIETLARYAEDAGLKRIVLVADDAADGKRAVESFRYQYTGDVLAELGASVTRPDMPALMKRIEALQPPTVVALLSGSRGRDFLTAWQHSGMAEKVMLYSLGIFDQAMTPKEQEASMGVFGAGIWTPGLETSQNTAFVTAFEAEFDYAPGAAAFEAFDAAMLIDGALRRVKGNVADKAALRAAVKQADFKSLRGGFLFGNNNFPVQDFYVLKVGRRPDGRVQPDVVKRVFTQFSDAYASECPLK